jgi:hypothetical protein
MKRNATNHTRCRTGTPVPALTHAHAQQDGNRTAMRGALDTGKRELNRDCPTHSHTPHRTPRRHRIAREPHMWSLRQCRRSSHLAYGKAATAQRRLCVSPVFAPSIPARPTTAAGCASHAHCLPCIIVSQRPASTRKDVSRTTSIPHRQPHVIGRSPPTWAKSSPTDDGPPVRRAMASLLGAPSPQYQWLGVTRRRCAVYCAARERG